MNKTFLSLFILLSFLSLHIKAQSMYRDNSFRYLGLEEIQSYHLYGKKENPFCDLHINFFYPFNSLDKNLQKQLQTHFISCFFGVDYASLKPEDAIKAYSKDYVTNYKNAFEKTDLYKEDQNKAKSQGEDMGSYNYFYNYKRTMRNTIKFNRGNIISQVINIYNYEGGPHGATSTQGVVYNISTDSIISYEEIFYEDTEDAISELLLSCLMSDNRYKNDTAMIEAGFTSSYIPPTNNFIADEKGITFIYNPYELGAYALGVVEIFVPYSELFVYMKSDNTLYRWAETTFSGNKLKYETSYLNKEYYIYDPDRIPGFTFQAQFTYPRAYYKKNTLEQLQKLFIKNAYGEEYISYGADEATLAFYEKQLQEYDNYMSSKEVKEFIAQELADNRTESEEAQVYFMSLGKEFTQTNVFHFNQNDLISYEIETYLYTGGAHGMESNRGFVVQLPEARNLSYNDIFLPGSTEIVTSLLINNLLKAKDYQDVNQLKVENYEIEKIVPNDNFYIDHEGITFIFTPYEIGPYVLGTTKIKILYSEVSDYLRIYMKN